MAVREDRVNLVITITNDSARKELGLLDQKAMDLRRSLKGMKKDSDEYAAASKELKQVESRMEELRSKIGLTGLTTRQLSQQLKELRAARQHITPGTEAFKENTKAIAATQARLKELNPAIQQTGSLFDRMKTSAVAQAGALAGAFITIHALIGGVKSLISTYTDFQQQMAEVKAISGATAEQFVQLEADAKRLGASTQFTATQVGELQKEYAKLGFSVPEILAATEATLDLATATGENLARSAEVVGATVRGFGLAATETKRVTDVMAESFNKTGLDLESFAESMKLVAPIAAAANIPIETTTALLGKLADSGIKGSLGGTALKNVISKLGDANSALSKELGFTVKNADDLNKAFKLLAERNIDLTEATELTDERAKAAFITLIRNADGAEILAKQLENAEGAAKSMADIMRSTVQGQFLEFKSAAEGLAIAIGEKLEPVFRLVLVSAIGFIRGIRALGEFLSENKTTILALGAALMVMNGQAILAAATTLKLAAAKKITTVATLTAAAAQRVWNVAVAAWPGLILVAAIFAVVKAIDFYQKNTTEAIKLDKDREAVTKKLTEANKELAEAQKKTTEQVNKLNELSPEQLQNLRDEIGLQIELAKAKLAKLRVDAAEIAQRSAEPTLLQKIKNGFLGLSSAYGLVGAEALNNEDAQRNMAEAMAGVNEQIKIAEEGISSLGEDYLITSEAANRLETAISTQPQTIGQYEKKLGDLNNALKTLVLGSEDYIRVQNEIKKTQAEFDSAKGKDMSAEQQKAINDLRKYQEQLRDIRIAAIDDEEQREIEALNEKYTRQIAALEREKTVTREQAEAKGALTKALEEQQQQEVAALRDKYAEERKSEEFARDSKNLKEWGEVQKLLIQEQLNDKVITEGQANEKRAELERELLKEKLQLAQEYGQDVVAIEQAIANDIAKQNEDELQRTQDHLLAKAQLRVLKAKEGTQEEFEARMELAATQMAIELENFDGTEEQKAVLRQEWLNAIEEMENQSLERSANNFKEKFDAVSQAVSLIGQIHSNENTKELQDDKKRNDAKKKNLDKQLKDNVISQEQYNEEVAKLDEQYEAKARKIKRDEFVKKQRASIIESIINTAVSATKVAWNPFLLAAALTLGALQTAAIASQPVPEFREGLQPQFKQRALVNRNAAPSTGQPTTGIVKGPSHEEEGIKLLDGQTGKIIGEMEGDEGIFSKKMYVNNKPIIDAIFEAKGAPVQIPSLSTPAPLIDTGRVIENIRVEKFENGRLPVPAATEAINVTAMMELMHEMHENNITLNNTLSDIKENGIEGVWEYDRYKRGKDLREKIERDSSLS